jgi:hypothetical protein
VAVTYKTDTIETLLDASSEIAAPPLTLDLAPGTVETLLPGSLWLRLGGDDYIDIGGWLYRNPAPATGSASLCGAIDYAAGTVQIDTYPAMAALAPVIKALLSRDGGLLVNRSVLRTPSAPVRDGSFSLRATTPDGTLRSASADNAGGIVATGVVGAIHPGTGVVRLAFGAMVAAAGKENEPWFDPAQVVNGQIWQPEGVLPESAFYNCVTVASLPLDANLLGLNPVRLPTDGRVPILRRGDVAVIHHTADQLLPDNLAAGQSVPLNRAALALVELRDQNGLRVNPTLYSVDLAAGVVTMANPLNLAPYTQPLIAAHRIEDMVLLADVQINGWLGTVAPLTHAYPAQETQVSGALIFGDLTGRLVRSFTQKTWANVWADSRSGDDSVAKYDSLNYPIATTNLGATAQRWAIKFTAATTYDVIGEQLGVIAQGNTVTDCAPLNPAANAPYFVIPWQGWGAGWVANNVLRFDTSGARASLWIARTTLPGPAEEPTDSLTLQLRGDAN